MPTPSTETPALSVNAWDGGWHRSAVRQPSPNFGPRPAGVVLDLLVLHSISLPPGEYGGGYVQALFANRLDWDAHPYFQRIRGLAVSAHFFITRSGALWQFVDCEQRAWHAGVSCYRGRHQCNDDSIGIELEGLEGQHFELAQYATLASLCHDLAARYPIQHVAGHEHIAPGRKADPGAGFDWPGLQQRLQWAAERFPAAAL
jgi:AmpD protein